MADPKTPTAGPGTTTYRGLPPSFRQPSFGSTLPASPLRYTATSSLHISEDSLVLEIGSRFLRAGFANEPYPRCLLSWSNTLFRRPGLPSASVRPPKHRTIFPRSIKLDDYPLELITDHVERGLREAYNRHLMTDLKQKRVLLPVPPLFPVEVLSAICHTIFEHFQPPSITLFSAPVLAAVAAGVRSALVVDIGFWETVVTPVYELRAIEGRGLGVWGRSGRGVGRLIEAWKELLPEVKEDLDAVEEAMERVGHCGKVQEGENDPEFRIPGVQRGVRWSDLGRPAEKTFLEGSGVKEREWDDDDQPLPEMMWEVLKRCTVDMRAACVGRVIFVGGGSRIPGLQNRVIEELKAIVEARGWRLSNREPLARETMNDAIESVEEGREAIDQENLADEEPAEKPQEVADPLKKPGAIRGVKSLGVWAGGSLLAGLKMKGKVELDREKFMAAVSAGSLGIPQGVI